jgi:hypothetical protein
VNAVKLMQPFTFYYGGKYLILGRRRSAARAAELRERDPRPIVLLLRAFGDDMMPIKSRWLRFSYADNYHYRGGVTFERVVTEQVAPYGPVVATGESSERLAPLGAARDYLASDTWREAVGRWMMEARMVIVIAGASEGVRWELARLDALALWRKTMLVFPPVDLDQLRSRWESVRERVPGLQPEHSRPDLALGRAVAVTFPSRDAVAVNAAWRDEWSYEVALRVAAALVAESASEPLAC